MIIIDVGAGLHTEYFKLLHKYDTLRIIAFEPTPELNDKLSSYSSEIKEYNRLIVRKEALSDSTKNNVKFYVVNDLSASSLLPFNYKDVKKWKYPIYRSSFKIIKTIDVNTITMRDFLNTLNTFNGASVVPEVDLIFIDVQGTTLNVLRGMTPKIFRHTKRIIVKCIDVDFELYENQDDIVDVIDHLQIHGFGVIRTETYSRNQEKIIEFINTKIYTPINLNPWLKLEKSGKITIDIDLNGNY